MLKFLILPPCLFKSKARYWFNNIKVHTGEEVKQSLSTGGKIQKTNIMTGRLKRLLKKKRWYPRNELKSLVSE